MDHFIILEYTIYHAKTYKNTYLIYIHFYTNTKNVYLIYLHSYMHELIIILQQIKKL